ncbi:transcription initiation factor TFIID subunit 4-like isoform X2 [Rhodnius prolixus]|uniref:transcription initiation factor TFIID subunit 4-like isoform X2 n=1 Tax=Rhodnius prolixus TaxID=13249 RepID=UPI003D188E01
MSTSLAIFHNSGNALWVHFEKGACADQFTVGFRQKMASAKFLEEALSTDVDESAVNAIVGSLETQLVTSSPAVPSQQGHTISVQQNHVNSTISNGARGSTMKHGVSNGGAESMNILLNAEPSKSATSEHHNAVNTRVVASLQAGAPSGQYINQVGNSIGIVQSVPDVNKSQDGVKLVYPSNNQSGISVNNRVCYTNQNVTLPNGNIGLTSNAVLQTSAQSFSQAGSCVNKVSGQSGMEQPKPTGTALVIKSGVNSSQSASPIATMTLTGNTNSIGVATSTGVPGVVTLTKPLTQAVGTQQTIVGGTPQIVPTNVQILNVNALRAATPGQGGGKTLPQRVMIGTPQMVGGRPVQSGQITLQAFQGLGPGTQGHLLLKTENGQYQLLRVAAPSAQQSQTIAGNNINTFRVQTIATAATTQGSTQVHTQVSPAQATQGTTTAVQNAAVVTQRGAVDQTKEKCRKFLANLLELSSREPKTVERNVRSLIQELVDMKVEPEQFCDRLERLLNASPQPCLIGFLKKSLPLLRQSMVNNELVIEGIRPPSASVVFPAATPPQTTQIRGSLQMATSQMRVIAQPQVRPGQQIQRIMTTPMKIATAQVGGVNKPTTLAPIRTPQVRPATTQIVRTSGGSTITLRPGQTLAKTQFTTRPVLSTTHQFPPPTAAKPSILVRTPPSKEREKKSFSSSGYMGDDDINDVAAMGGVNLAEESQRILGSTEFVGTQIRSCKDEIFLHSVPLVNKIAQIANKYGLEEPALDVAALVSHATQERLKTFVEKLAVIAEHRIDLNKADPRYEITQDVRSQLKCLEEIDKAERKRHEEQERELLLRAAKSRSKPEDPEQAKLKAKAKEMQRAEMEELRQREANLTALLAIGPRKKPKLDENSNSSISGVGPSSSTSTNMVLRPRVKRVCMRDLLMLMEQERETCRSQLLYRSYFK